MATKRQLKFLASVADAARASTRNRRGRPNPQNLTEEGRQKGLRGLREAPRCRSKRRDGMPCQAPAIKRATRCLKHGGRTEVPAHASNIRRFMKGKLAGQAARVTSINGEELEAPTDRPMGYLEKREFRAALPELVSLSSRQYDEAVRMPARSRSGTI